MADSQPLSPPRPIPDPVYKGLYFNSALVKRTAENPADRLDATGLCTLLFVSLESAFC